MLKPQDILAILKIHSWDSTNWTYSSLAQSLGMSASEVHAALERSEAAGLYYGSQRKILKQAVFEFLVHGLRYVFYAQPGSLSRGLPTAHSAEPLKSKLVASPSEVYVWPDPQGVVRGQAIAPLYRSVPQAANNDPKLYALLSLIDAIRVGRVREQRLAIGELEKRLVTL
jgi:DNA-binding transcriptional MocR family regulator